MPSSGSARLQARDSDRDTPPRATPLQRALLAGLVLLLAGLAGASLYFGGRAAWSGAQAIPARWLVTEWRAGEGPAATPERWEQALQELRAALQTGPESAELHSDIAFLHAERAVALGTPPENAEDLVYQQALLDQAITHYRAATALRPTFPYAWAYLALALHYRGQTDAPMWAAFDKALAFGVNEGGVQQALATVAFAHWNALGRERQQLVTGMVAASHSNVRPLLLELAQSFGVDLPESAKR